MVQCCDKEITINLPLDALNKHTTILYQSGLFIGHMMTHVDIILQVTPHSLVQKHRTYNCNSVTHEGMSVCL